MKLICSVVVDIETIHKSGTIIPLEEKIVQEIEEDSEKHKELCEFYQSAIGYPREENKERFDKEMLEIMSEEAKETVIKTIDEAIATYKRSTLKSSTNGYISLGGYTLNVNDFSGIKINDYRVNIKKV